MKIVINRFHDGLLFFLTDKALMKYAEIKEIKLYRYEYDSVLEGDSLIYTYKPSDKIPGKDRDWIRFNYYTKKLKFLISDNEIEDGYFDIDSIERNNPALIQVVEELNLDKGEYAPFKIVEIPDGVDWIIQSDDSGGEWVAENHRTWS